MAEKMNLDFSQVKDGGSFSPKHKPEGEYLGTITSFQDTKSKAGAAMWVYGITLKNDRRAIYPTYCLLGAEQVWKLRNLMVAAGFKVPKKRMSVDGNRLVGKEVGIFLEDDEYEGKKKSVISSFFPANEYSGPEDDDDNAEEDEEYEEETSDDTAEDEEYEDEVPEEEADEESDDTEDDEDSEEDDADEEDEPEDTPPPAAKKAPAKKSAPARAKTKKAAAPVEEEDDEMDVDDL